MADTEEQLRARAHYAVEAAIGSVCGSDKTVRLINWDRRITTGSGSDGSLNLVTFVSMFTIEDDMDGITKIASIEFSSMYSVTVDPWVQGSKQTVHHKYTSVHETISPKFADVFPNGYIEKWAALTRFISLIVEWIGIPRSIADHFSITSINGGQQ